MPEVHENQQFKDRFDPQEIKKVGDLRKFLKGIPDEFDFLWDDLILKEFKNLQLRVSESGPGVIAVIPEQAEFVQGEQSDSKFRRAIVEVELLYDAEIGPNPDELTLSQIAHEIVEGHMSGSIDVIYNEGVSRERMTELLEGQGSDPEFLLGDEEEEESAPE